MTHAELRQPDAASLAQMELSSMPFSEPLQAARGTIGTILTASKIGGTAGSCLYAAILLQMMIRLYCGRDCAVIRGGDGRRDGGYIDAAGSAHGHYWVEATDDSGARYVLDVTADQFGGPTMVLMPLTTASDTYLPGDQHTIDAHVAEELGAMTASQPTPSP